MTTVTLTDAQRALQAGNWCNVNLKHNDWDMIINDAFSKSPKYNFSFANAKNATLFALKWL